VDGLQFAASIVNSLAWPLAAVVAVGLLRPDLSDIFKRMRSVTFPGGKATFNTLLDYEKMIAAVARDTESPADEAIVQDEATQFSAVEAMTSAAPAQAVIDAWGLLEYQLNIVSDQIAPDQPHGWPQVASTLQQAWDKWPLVYPVVMELRWLRDYTVRSSKPPSSADAARYVSLAMDVATTLRAAFSSQSEESPSGEK
jgi:hypothetical protein